MVPDTLWKVLEADVPRAVTAPMQTTIIRASITAYSTAVGPSSALTKFTTLRTILLNIVFIPFTSPQKGLTKKPRALSDVCGTLQFQTHVYLADSRAD